MLLSISPLSGAHVRPPVTMKLTIFLIAVFVANELDNRGYPLLAAVLIFTAVGEAFLFEWIDRATLKIRNWYGAFWNHFEQATGAYRKLLVALVSIIGLSVSVSMAAAIFYAAFSLGLLPVD